jgi:hypothetical protein
MRSALSAAGLAATLLVLTVVATAQARVAHDPCGSDPSPADRQINGVMTSCFRAILIPPFSTEKDPGGPPTAGCPSGFSLSSNPLELLEGHAWDFWATRGEWVTWNLQLHTPRDAHGSIQAAIPSYHNWGSWHWDVRTFNKCTRYSGLRALRLADEPAHPQPVALGQGDDVDHGTAKDDDERGGKGDDTLNGGAGDDELLGGPGKDHLYGGPGNDELFDDQGEDVLMGGPGDDRFSTRDGNQDIVDCGPGDDIAIGDPHDTFRHCEHVYTTPENTPAHPPHIG